MKDKTTYQQPKPTPVPDFAGYPEKVANTQTNKCFLYTSPSPRD